MKGLRLARAGDSRTWQASDFVNNQLPTRLDGVFYTSYSADDYSLPEGSPGVGFVVFDPNQAGRSNPVSKPPATPATGPTKLFNPATDY